MKVKSFLAMALMALLATGCSDDDEPKLPTSEGVKEMTVNADYSLWTYVDLKSGNQQTCTVEGPWKYTLEEGFEEKNPEIKGSVPAKWDLAFHQYEIRTNNGQAVQTSETELDAVKELPTAGLVGDITFKAEDKKLIVDISGMMQGKIGYAGGMLNTELGKWLTKTPTGTMPPYKYKITDNVYVVKLANGDWVKIKFLDRLNGSGDKAVKFTYEYMSK